MKDRDNQKQRLYDAETPLKSLGLVSKSAKKYLGVQTLKVHSHQGRDDSGKLVDIYCADDEQLMKYVNSVLEAAWFQRRWGHRRLRLEHKARTWSWGGHGTISISRVHRRQEAVILHEIAHNLTAYGNAGHGPEFAYIFLTLVRYQMGPEVYNQLRAGYRKYRVRTNVKAVPAPSAAKLAAARGK